MSDELKSSLTSVAKGAGIVFLGTAAASVLGMINQIILGRILGPDSYGLFNLALSVVSIASTLAVFGLFGALSRFIAYHLQKDETGKVKGTIEFSSRFVVFTGLVFAATLFVLAQQISVGIFHEPRLTTPLRFFALGIPLFALRQALRGIARGFKAAKYDAVVFNIGDRLVKIAFFLAAALLAYRLYGAIAAFVAGALVTTIVMLWLVRHRLFPAYRTATKKTVTRELLSFSWPLALTGFTYLFVSQTDKILLGHFLTAEDVGIYSPALVIAGMLVFVPNAFRYILLPTVSEYFARDDISGLGLIFKTTSKWMLLIVLPLVVLILLFPREIITLLYGEAYAAGQLALIVLSIGIAVNGFAGAAGNILVGAGHTRLNLSCEVIAAVTNVILNIVLIPRYGMLGAAIATSTSYLTRTVTSLGFVYATCHIHPYTTRYLSVLASGVVAAAIVFIGKQFSPLPWYFTMALLSIVFVLAYLKLARVARSFDSSDSMVIDAIEQKLGIRLGLLRRLF